MLASAGSSTITTSFLKLARWLWISFNLRPHHRPSDGSYPRADDDAWKAISNRFHRCRRKRILIAQWKPVLAATIDDVIRAP